MVVVEVGSLAAARIALGRERRGGYWNWLNMLYFGTEVYIIDLIKCLPGGNSMSLSYSYLIYFICFFQMKFSFV